jgi:predicted metal-dependent TIM-barrel fold hydrolase
MKKIIAFSLFSAALCLAHKPLPFPVERYQIDQVYKAVGEPALRAEAVGLLTAIALGDDPSAVPTPSLRSAVSRSS